MDVEQAAVQPAGPVVALHEADSNAAPTVAQSDDEGAASDAPKAGCDTSECGSAEEGAGGVAAADFAWRCGVVAVVVVACAIARRRSWSG